MSKSPVKGDKLYRVWNGVLEIVIFIGINYYSSDKKIQTYKIKDSGGISVCSKEMYKRTAKEAWEKYFKECEDAAIIAKSEIIKAEEHYNYCLRQYDLALRELYKLEDEGK